MQTFDYLFSVGGDFSFLSVHNCDYVKPKACPCCSHTSRVNTLEELFRPSGIGIRECTALGDLFYADMMQFPDLGCHCRLYLTQRVETHDYCEEHGKQVSVPVKALNILLSTVFAANFNDFITVKRSY